MEQRVNVTRATSCREGGGKDGRVMRILLLLRKRHCGVRVEGEFWSVYCLGTYDISVFPVSSTTHGFSGNFGMPYIVEQLRAKAKKRVASPMDITKVEL